MKKVGIVYLDNKGESKVDIFTYEIAYQTYKNAKWLGTFPLDYKDIPGYIDNPREEDICWNSWAYVNKNEAVIVGYDNDTPYFLSDLQFIGLSVEDAIIKERMREEPENVISALYEGISDIDGVDDPKLVPSVQAETWIEYHKNLK